jgi:hypothetical protein
MVQKDKLFRYYKNNVVLMTEHKLSLSELDNMVPYEREIYISLLNQVLEEKGKT